MSLKLEYQLEDFDKNKIVSKYVDNDNVKLFMADTCFRRMVKFVPWREGVLATTVSVEPGKVTYEVPYAHKQYTQNKGRGLRGAYWDRRMKSAEGNAVAKEVEAFIKKGT